MMFGTAETLHIPERLVVAPGRGRFFPLTNARGQWVSAGQVIGEIRAGEGVAAVTSAFAGHLMGCLALANQPVNSGDPLFWLRTV